MINVKPPYDCSIDCKHVEHLTDILVEGIDEDVFNAGDAEKIAIFLLTIVDGAILEVTTRTGDLRPVMWERMDEYMRDYLIRDEVDVGEYRNDDFELTDDA